MIRPLVVGNWKMNGTLSQASRLAAAIVEGIAQKSPKAALALAPAGTALVQVQQSIAGSVIGLAGQNCHWEDAGAFTGEISPVMLRDAGCTYVIIGHSERRHIFHESDEMIAKKLAAAMRNNLRAILCVGETLDEREGNRTKQVIMRQLQIALKDLKDIDIARVEVAYEPVWAIGTGHNADPKQIAEVHEWIRSHLTSSFEKSSGIGVRILYGGSVNPGNANELAKIAEVNGLLVGGASLKPETFFPVIYCFDNE
jgi:triosephosphate isomerase (TIM)